jgi:SAM-dependent methyltransferase
VKAPPAERWTPHPGASTAHEQNVPYRVAKFAECVRGSWLDFGCADGGYAAELLAAGAEQVTGVDVRPERIAEARARGISAATFQALDGESLPFDADSFDGAFVNEVMEHVVDEETALGELRRVLRPGGMLVVISPNRWFPFEGHGIRIGAWRSSAPTPFVPWLPTRVSQPMMEARNYWPGELAGLVREAGFDVERIGFVWPVFEQYAWLPSRWSDWYRERIAWFDSAPVIRRFGVSTLVLARRAP